MDQPPAGDNPDLDPTDRSSDALSDEGPARSGHREKALIVAVLVLTLIIATVMVIGSGASGADTPETAVRHFLDALDESDPNAAVEHLDPVERRLFAGEDASLAADLMALGLVPPTDDAVSVPIPIADDALATAIVSVDMVDAKVALATVSPAVLWPDASARTDELVVAVEREGRWYVSMQSTRAERVRAAAQLDPPTYRQGPPAIGATTPETAVDNFIRVAVGRNISAVVSSLPPDTGAAVRDHSTLFLDRWTELRREYDEAHPGLATSVTALELSTVVDGDRAIVSVDRLAVRLADVGVAWRLDTEAECLVTEIGTTAVPECAIDDEAELPSGGLGIADRDDTGIIVVRVNGFWYVEATPEITEAMLAGLYSSGRTGLPGWLAQIDPVIARLYELVDGFERPEREPRLAEGPQLNGLPTGE